MLSEENRFEKIFAHLKRCKLLALASLKNDYVNDRHIYIGDHSQSFKHLRTQETLYVDSGHLLPKGNQIIAERIFNLLNEFDFLTN